MVLVVYPDDQYNKAPERNAPAGCSECPHLSKQLIKEAFMDLDSQCTDHEVGRELFTLLPTLSQACRLCDIFLEHGQFACAIIKYENCLN